MNKQTLANLKKYVQKNVLKFVRQHDGRQQEVYVYKELEIGWGGDFGGNLIYFITICGKYMDSEDGLPREFIESLFNMIKNRKEKSEADIQKQKFNDFIKKINKGEKNEKQN